jgi:hypothetical protein
MRDVGARAQLFILALVAAGVVACKADTPPLTDGDGDLDEECTPYADLVVAYTPAAGGSADDGLRALGAPGDQFVTIATDDILTVGFIGLGAIEEMEELGDDIRVHATAADGTEVAANLSIDGETWETAGTIGNFDPESDTDIDIADTASLSIVIYVQLVGVSGQLAVDAVESLQTVCPTSVR